MVSETSPSVSAQQWGKTAVAFIGSATATGIFGLLSYVLWPVAAWLGETCLGVAAIACVVLAIQSIAIVKWWIIIAKRTP